MNTKQEQIDLIVHDFINSLTISKHDFYNLIELYRDRGELPTIPYPNNSNKFELRFHTKINKKLCETVIDKLKHKLIANKYEHHNSYSGTSL